MDEMKRRQNHIAQTVVAQSSPPVKAGHIGEVNDESSTNESHNHGPINYLPVYRCAKSRLKDMVCCQCFSSQMYAHFHCTRRKGRIREVLSRATQRTGESADVCTEQNERIA